MDRRSRPHRLHTLPCAGLRAPCDLGVAQLHWRLSRLLMQPLISLFLYAKAYLLDCWTAIPTCKPTNERIIRTAQVRRPSTPRLSNAKMGWARVVAACSAAGGGGQPVLFGHPAWCMIETHN